MSAKPVRAIEIPYYIGQQISVGATDEEAVNAVVIGICIQDTITYNCAWIHDGERKSAWFTESEIRTASRKTAITVGFSPIAR